MSDDLKNEIDEMMKALETPVVEEPEVDDKKEEEREPEVTPEPESTDGKEPESEAEEEPEATTEDEAEPEPEKEPEPDEKDAIIADLRAKLAEKEAGKEPPKEPTPTPPPEPLKLEDQDFVGEIDLDDLSRDPAEFNKFLNKVYRKAVEDAQKGAEERVLKSLPTTVQQVVSNVNALKTASENFYNENEDLKSFQKVVSTVFGELAEANQGKTYNEILTLVGPEVRKRLNLPTNQATPKSKSKDKDANPPPPLPKKGSRSGKVVQINKPNELQGELEEMSKVIKSF